jgi:uncharacterized repeat protein (TIGR03806 family)
MLNEGRQSTSTSLFLLALMTLSGACSSTNAQHSDGGSAGSGGATGVAGTGGSGGGGAGGSVGGMGGGQNVVQTCVPPLAVDQPIAKLSDTGCMDPADNKKMAASVIPYEVNSPLWSDGADKQRGMALPTGAKIHVKDCAANPSECLGPADDGKWVMPIGTVMVKSFLFDGKLVETRLFVRFDATTWVGYSYKWDEAQTDATIVADERVDDPFNTGKQTVMWHLPSRMDCMTCHKETGGSTLGPETAQMNRVVSGMNQIDRLKALGRFEAPPASPYKAALATPTDTAGTVEDRARAYLAANCAFCHRPDDSDFGSIDFRRDTAFKDMNVCGANPERGNQGVPTSLLLTPTMPLQSLIVLRMTAPPDDAGGKHGRMPKIASYVVDDAAVKLISDWITAIKTCPQ